MAARPLSFVFSAMANHLDRASTFIPDAVQMFDQRAHVLRAVLVAASECAAECVIVTLCLASISLMSAISGFVSPLGRGRSTGHGTAKKGTSLDIPRCALQPRSGHTGLGSFRQQPKRCRPARSCDRTVTLCGKSSLLSLRQQASVRRQ
jgi:hypothetical protein